MSQNLESIKECPTCASPNIFYSELRDQIICRDCGLIFEPLAPEAPKPFHIRKPTTPKLVKVKPRQPAKKKAKKKPVKKTKKKAKKAAKKKKRT